MKLLERQAAAFKIKTFLSLIESARLMVHIESHAVVCHHIHKRLHPVAAAYRERRLYITGRQEMGISETPLSSEPVSATRHHDSRWRRVCLRKQRHHRRRGSRSRNGYQRATIGQAADNLGRNGRHPAVCTKQSTV